MYVCWVTKSGNLLKPELYASNKTGGVNRWLTCLSPLYENKGITLKIFEGGQGFAKPPPRNENSYAALGNIWMQKASMYGKEYLKYHLNTVLQVHWYQPFIYILNISYTYMFMNIYVTHVCIHCAMYMLYTYKLSCGVRAACLIGYWYFVRF